MSLKEATYYYVECDRAGCGARTGDMSEFSAWSDGGQAVDDWTNGDGYLDPDTGETFCGDHRPKLCAECDARATGVDADGDDACDEHRVTPSTPAPAASSPVPQAASGTVAEPAAAAPVARTVTPDRKNADGSTTIKVQRCCNGCGNPIGDVTLAEIDCAITGAPLPDVRPECPRCSVPAGGAS